MGTERLASDSCVITDSVRKMQTISVDNCGTFIPEDLSLKTEAFL